MHSCRVISHLLLSWAIIFPLKALCQAVQVIKKTYYLAYTAAVCACIFSPLKYSRCPEAVLSFKGFLCKAGERSSRAWLLQLICSHTCDFSASSVKMKNKEKKDRYYVSDLKPRQCNPPSLLTENSQSISHIHSSISLLHLLYILTMGSMCSKFNPAQNTTSSHPSLAFYTKPYNPK